MTQPTRIRAQASGDRTAVRMLLGHEMESGQRKDAAGQTLPAWFIREVSVLLNGKPVELVREGRVLERNLRKSLISRDELLSRLREHGTESIRKVRLAYLEPDGKVTFLMKKDGEGQSLQ